MPVACVLGARHLGGALLDDLAAHGWGTAGVARSDGTLGEVRARGALAIEADAADVTSLDAALARVRTELGGLDLVVNAVRANEEREDRPDGGGAILEATLEDHRDWSTAIAEQAFVFLSSGARALADGGTLIQVTGGSALVAEAGAGPWAAGAFGQRALVQAAAQELRPRGVHVALLVVRGEIESAETEAAGARADELVDPVAVAAAVRFLAAQDPRTCTHELVLDGPG